MRIKGIPPVEVNSLLSSLRHRIDQTDTFVPTGPVDIVEMEPVETNTSASKVTKILDLEDEGFIFPFNPLLTRSDSLFVWKISDPSSYLTNNHPLWWVVMEGTSKVYRLGAPTTPTLTIITRGIFPPGISNQTTNVVQSTIFMSLNSSTLLIVRSTQPMGVALSLSLVSNTFLFDMSSMSIQNILTSSQSISQATNVGT